MKLEGEDLVRFVESLNKQDSLESKEKRINALRSLNKARVLNSLKESMEEVKLIQEGKIEKRKAREFLEEIWKNINLENNKTKNGGIINEKIKT